MGNVHVAVGHDCLQVSIAQFIREVPSYREKDDLSINVTALE
jgi:hypothetical protein